MPAPQIKIAVLLAAYNGMQWIEEQIASIQSQTGVTVHIFISVDASSDATQAWCADYAAAHANASLLPPAEGTGGASRNFFHLLRTVDIEEFDFVALSDQDDRWHPDKLLRAAYYLSTYPVDCYSSNVTAFWPDGTRQVLDKAQPQVRWDHYFEAAGPGCTYVMAKAFVLRLQGEICQQWDALQQVTLHDWYIYAFARSNGYRWHIDAKSGMDYRQHQHNQVGANVGLQALFVRYRMIRNGWWFGQVKLIEALVNDEKKPTTRPHWRALSRIDLIVLGLGPGQCRRRLRDRCLFRILCIVTAIIGARIK